MSLLYFLAESLLYKLSIPRGILIYHLNPVLYELELTHKMSLSSFLPKLYMILIWITSEESPCTWDAQAWVWIWLLPYLLVYTFPNKTTRTNKQKPQNFLLPLSRPGIALGLTSMLFPSAAGTKSFCMF